MDDHSEHSVEEDLPEAIHVTDVLDLHGLFPQQIPEIMDAFIENAGTLGIEELRVIHGKGKSRLKFEVYQFLKNDKRIVSFHDAPPLLGGWGATVIYLNSLTDT
jgi:DNA mismatch repair protein MutS2